MLACTLYFVIAIIETHAVLLLAYISDVFLIIIQSREDMTDLAASIVDRCQKMAEFANLVAKQCTDQM